MNIAGDERMCVVSISLARANRVGFWRRDTKNVCYYPPTESGWLLEITENFCYYPPPTESGRLLEITENSQLLCPS